MDESTKWVSRAFREWEHIPIERNKGQAQAALAQAVELREAEVDQDKAMVTKRKMTVDWFIPSAQPSAQPQGRDRAPPSHAANCPKKKQKVGDHPLKVPGDIPTKIPPQGGIMIQEPVVGSQPPTKGNKDVASSSRPENICSQNSSSVTSLYHPLRA